MEIVPDEFDLVVVGTGLQESLIAAAASLAGKSVLHLDPQPEYGSLWAGLTLDRFLEWADQSSSHDSRSGGSDVQDANGLLNGTSASEAVVCDGALHMYSDFEINRQEGGNLGSLRQYNIDLAPKLLYTMGPMAEALLKCKADSYLVFRLIPSYLWQGSKAVGVPASRGDIFKSPHLSPAEKRILMRFLKGALEALQGGGSLADEFDDRPFISLLERQGVPPALQQVVLYCLAMSNRAEEVDATSSCRQQAAESNEAEAATSSGRAEAPTPQGSGPLADNPADAPASNDESAPSTSISSRQALEELKLYVSSVSRHGGAFMLPDYGAGELPQAFCRVAAVQGALYVLRCGIASVLLEGDSTHRCTGVRTANDQIIRCKALAAAAHHLPASFLRRAAGPSGVSRAIMILSSPLIRGDPDTAPQSGQLLLTVPPGGISNGVPRDPVRALQLGSHSSVAPSDRYVVNLSTRASNSSKADLEAVVSTLLREGEATRQPLLSVYYNQKTQMSASDELPDNVALCQPPDEAIGFGGAIQGAEVGFARLFPGSNFLPPLPQPAGDSDSD